MADRTAPGALQDFLILLCVVALSVSACGGAFLFDVDLRISVVVTLIALVVVGVFIASLNRNPH